MSRKKWLLVRSEVLAMFVNTMTPDDSILVKIWRISCKKIEMQLSKKEQTFSGFFIAFLKITSNSEYLKKKHEFHSLSISEIFDCKIDCYLNA